MVWRARIYRLRCDIMSEEKRTYGAPHAEADRRPSEEQREFLNEMVAPALGQIVGGFVGLLLFTVLALAVAPGESVSGSRLADIIVAVALVGCMMAIFAIRVLRLFLDGR